MRLFGTAALIVVALAASQCAAQSAERASIQLSRVEPQQESLRERKLPKDRKKKHNHHHQQETQTEGTPIPPEEYYDKQTRQQQPSCSVCGDGMKVGNPDASVSFPGQAGQIPCGVLQNMGTVGLIPPPQCAVLPQLISTICECESTTPPTTTVAPTTTTKPHSGKAGKSTQQSHSMSVPSKAGKSIHGNSVSGKSNKKTVITTKTYKSSSSKGSKMIASKASNKSKTSSKGEKSASKSSKSSGTVDAKAEKVSSSKAAKSAVPKAEKMSARA